MLEDSFSGEARFATDSTFSLCSLFSQASSLLSGVSLIGVPIPFFPPQRPHFPEASLPNNIILYEHKNLKDVLLAQNNCT